jgi:hypothetical protein
MPNEVYFHSGALLTIWEELLVGIYLKCNMHKWSYGNVDFWKERVNTNILLIPVLICLILLFVHPKVLDEYHFVLFLSEGDYREGYISKDLFEVLSGTSVRILKIVLPAYFIGTVLKSKSNIKSLKTYYLCLSIFTVFYAFFIEGNSRNSIIIPAVAMLFNMKLLFPKRTKQTILLCVGVIVFVSIISTIWKTSHGTGITDHLLYSNSELSYYTTYFEIYFAGISNMGKAVCAYGKTANAFNISVIWNDLTQNAPILSHASIWENSSAFFYSKVWERYDQVIPMTGNGIIYFGFLFGPIMPILAIRCARYFEKKAYSSSNVVMLNIYVYATAVVAYNIYNALSLLMMKITIFIVPLILINYIVTKLNKQSLHRSCVR